MSIMNFVKFHCFTTKDKKLLIGESPWTESVLKRLCEIELRV